MMQATRLLTASALALGVLAVSVSAHAQKPKESIAVLGLEVVDRGQGIDAASAQFAAALTEELRRRASMSDHYALAPNSDKDLLEMKLLSDCADEGRECMSAIGAELGTDRLAYGKVEKRTGGYQVSLRLIDVASQSMERTLTEVIPLSETRGDDLKRWARTFFNGIIGVPNEGGVVVTANVSEGQIFVDGNLTTQLAGGTAELDGLSEGLHTIGVEAKGHRRWEGSITVVAGEVEEINIELQVLAGPGGGGGVTERPGGTSRALFWTSVVATGAAVTAFTITGLQVRGFEDDKQVAFEALAADGVDLSTEPRDGNGDFVDVCAIGERFEGSNTNADALADACGSGKNRAMLTNVFIGVSVATAAAAAYFYYAGYVSESSQERSTTAERRRRRSSRSIVTITPAVGPEVVGAGVSFEF